MTRSRGRQVAFACDSVRGGVVAKRARYWLGDTPSRATNSRRIDSAMLCPAAPARRYVPTTAESDLAVAWQRCTAESGLSTTLQPMARDAQMAAVLKHEDQLTEYATRTAEAARRLAAIG
ncbi:hypothetical protein [Dactylosporangium sp. NPDC051484]|uniref:hypothetical protein n=1 Tax=Dactylosporangium sp. NPDC051484 TaxID=3154942 RepID=UPI00344D5FA7